MPTATKKLVVTKKSAPTVVEKTTEEVRGEADAIIAKNKKPIEIGDLEPVVAGVEEKSEEDPLVATTEEEDTEEAVLDGEELNPFGDRWEE